MEQTEKTLMGAAAAVAVLSFLPWFSFSASGEMGRMMGGMSVNAFDSTEGILAFLAALATVGLVVADRSGALPWDRKICLVAPLISSGIGVLFMLFFQGGGPSFSMAGVSAGKTFWYYLALLAMIVAGWQAFRRWQAGTEQSESPPPPPADAPS